MKQHYILIKNDKPSQVEAQVTELLNKGYELVGGPIVGSTGYLIQALVKRIGDDT